jgi:hypothetical protein
MSEMAGEEQGSGSVPARLTPYELVFTEGDFESRIFPRIQDEALAEGVAALRRETFDFLSTVGELVREVTPEDAPAEALEQYRAMLYHAFHFWSAGRKLFALETPVARYLVEAAPRLESWSFRLPSESVYLQLPANLFWSSISPESTPEPVDGFFVTLGQSVDLAGQEIGKLEILVVLGIHRSRAGFSVIPLDTPIGSGIEQSWAEEEGRQGGDFENVLPGGEISGLYSILTAGEVLKLVARAFWYIEQFPETLLDVQAPEPREGDADPPSTHFGYVRVTLGTGAPEGQPEA